MILQYKIFSSYIILVAVIGSMVTILLHERGRMREIEAETSEIREFRRNIDATHRQITVLATQGESVVGWDEEEYNAYHDRRLHVDSLLLSLKENNGNFIRSEQIDTLRMLLADKESHLLRIMQAFRKQEEADSLLANRLPAVTRQVTRPRTVVRKRKGIAGWFGKKDTIRVASPSSVLQTLNKRLITMQEERRNDLDNYADSLRRQNKELNRKLYAILSALDRQAHESFSRREQDMEKAQKYSYRLVAGTVGAAIILLVLSHMVIQRDIRRRERDRIRLEDTLKQNKALSEMRKRIIVTLSHDIRGPLNAICGSAELALDTRDRKRRNTYIGNIICSSRHITRLANSLLDLSRLNEAKETLNKVPFNLSSLLERITEEYTRIANDKGLLFVHDIQDAGLILSGDADRIDQVISNLLSNAVKFTKSGTVSLSARYKDGVLFICVSDTGIGMDEETVQRIFRPFERAAPDVDSAGFGLGLAITKGLVNLLGGSISVSSRVGEGSMFKVEIPLPITDGPVANSTMPPDRKRHLPKSVLVVDDDPIQLRIVGEMLERNGISCRMCLNAKEVVNGLRNGKYDLLLADIQMQGTGGFDLLYLLRHSNIGDSRIIPVVAMTARNDEDDNHYTEAGFAGCIRKPFSMNELLSFISSVAGNRESGNEYTADFEGLAAATGDRQWMLGMFMEESLGNKAELRRALQDNETGIKRMKETLHRMYPTWEQLGIAHELELYSEALYSDNPDASDIKRHTETVMERMDRLVAEAQSLLADSDKEKNENMI